MIWEVAAGVMGTYAMAVGATAAFQRSLIYHPGTRRKQPGDHGLPEMNPVPVRAEDGQLVTGWYAPPPKRERPTVVFFHGNSGSLADRAHKARALLDLGCGVFLAGYRGYGGEAGSPSEKGLLADSRAALMWLLGRGVPELRLVLYGESLGTGIAIALADGHDELAGVILEAPFTDLADLAPPFLLPGLAQMLMVDRFDNRARLGKLTQPLLVVHGEQDDLVPPAMGREVLALARSHEKHSAFLPQAGHNDTWDHGGWDAVAEFLQGRGRW